MQDHEKASAAAAPDGDAAKPDALQRAFAQALGRELDRIGYPAPPARTNQLSQDLGLGRMQAYRIIRGDNLPTLKALLKLQKLGVSLDTVLSQLDDEPAGEAEVSVNILGVALKARALRSNVPTPFVLSHRAGYAELRLLSPGEQPAADELPIGGLRFTRPQPTVAVVEDDPADLAVLCKQIESTFVVKPFRHGRTLLDDAERLAAFDAILMDWRLPDIDGADLVNGIRAHTRAPIIVTTGERRESQAISQILHLPNLRYVDKPTDGNILRALLQSAISEAGAAASSSAAWPTKQVQPIE